MYKMTKPYKEEKPVVTINKIRSILNEIGIFVSEKNMEKPNGDFFACRVRIANDNLDQFDMGTNGKGTTIEYAYASAYAEFMERLQNNLLIPKSYFFSKYYDVDSAFKKQLKLEGKELDFIFCPEEKKMAMAEIIDEQHEMLCKSMFINDKEDLKDFVINSLGYNDEICVPFYNQKENKIDYLPIALLFHGTGSNGLCAGNTPEEALVQGISEVLERYATLEIYINKITPPTIPHDYFKEYSIYHSIKKIEEKGFELIIKDFSLGRSLPVIGVIVIDKKHRKYNVKVGSDPSPIIALERCFTELYQGLNGINLIPKCDYSHFIDEKYNGIDRVEAEHVNLMKICINSTGQWPDELFSDDFSYKFTGLNFNLGESNNADLKYLVQLIEELGSQIYIRDVSYLGFNSYYVVAPGLSQIKRNKSEYVLANKLLSLIEKKVNIAPSLSKEELNSLVSLLEENYIAINDQYTNFEKLFRFNTDSDAKDLTLDLFLSMANYKLGNIDKAYLYLNTYLKDKEAQYFLYFYACKDYLALLKDGKNREEIESYLTKIYDTELAKEVIDDMQDADNIFKSYNLQSYFECKDCDIKDFKYFNVATILKNIENKHKTQPIDQMNLSKIF